MKLFFVPLSFAALGTAVLAQPAPTGTLKLELLSTYRTSQFDESAAEIVAHDPLSQHLFIVNAQAATLDVLDILDPTEPVVRDPIRLGGEGEVANSVDVFGGVVAVALEAADKTQPGQVVFLDATGRELSRVEVGALPDMLTFTPDGTKVVVANEGEPAEDYATDPEGSVSIIDVSGGAAEVTQADVTTADFRAFEGGMLDPAVRIFGPGASVAQDLEPEYVAVSADSATAWVSLQENNALAVVDLASGTVRDVIPLGLKDHSLPENALDASNEDGGINFATYPVLGMYQPDAVAAFTAGGETYLVSANEGDGRAWEGFDEEASVGDDDYVLDPAAFPDAAALKDEARLGALTVTRAGGDPDGDGDYDEIHAFGGRSVAVWDARGELIFDSGSTLERLTAARYPEFFNATNDENGPETFDDRSDNKGPEPEGVVVGRVGGRTYAFVGLERIGGVVTFDLSNPAAPALVDYINPRDFTAAADSPAAGDLGPEGLLFIPATDSPTGNPLLVVANEVSGSTSIFSVQETAAAN